MKVKKRILMKDFRELTPVSVYFLTSWFFLLYFQLKGLGNDFPTFYEAGKATQTLNSPWAVNAESEYSAYLNGPISSLIFGLFAFLPYEISLLLVRALSLALIPFAVRSICCILDFKVITKNVYLLSTVLLFTFPVKSNLEYGQFAIIFSSVFIVFLNSARIRPNRYYPFILGFLSALGLDYKPQLFLPAILVLLLGNFCVFYGFATGCAFSLASSWILSGNLVSTWIDAIIGRSQNSNNGSDQMSPYALLNLSNNATKVTAFTLTAIFFGACILEMRKLEEGQKYSFVLISFGIWSAITPFSHPTDMYISILFGLCILFATSNLRNSPAIMLLFSFAIAWSNNLLITAVSALVVWILLVSISSEHFLKRPIFITVFLIELNFVPLVRIIESDMEGLTRQTLNIISVFSVVILSGRFYSMKRSRI